jgi:hypothetical protein
MKTTATQPSVSMEPDAAFLHARRLRQQLFVAADAGDLLSLDNRLQVPVPINGLL